MFSNNKSNKSIIYVLAIIFLFTNLMNFKVLAEDDISTVLRENATSLDSIELDTGFDDLESLKSILEDKKVIAIGESTLGANEFYKIKSRIIEFLVEEMNYRTIVFDANVSDVEVVNDYINGTGDIEDAIWVLKPFPLTAEKLEENKGYRLSAHTYLAPYTTEEFSIILNWMRDYNREVNTEDKIKAYGIGFENPEKSAEDLIDYISKIDNVNEKAYRKRLTELKMIHSLDFKYPESRPLGLLGGFLEELSELLDLNKDEYSDKNLGEYEAAEKDISTLFQWIEYSLVNLNRGMDIAINTKEKYLFENTKWVLEREGKKENRNEGLILWSNNKNISKDSKNYISMGMHLDKEFEDGYYSLGMDFFKGRFRAYGVDIWGSPISNFIAKFHIDKSGEKYFSYMLEKAGIPIYFLDFHDFINDDKMRDILNSKQKFHNSFLMYPGKHTPTSLLPYWTQQYIEEVPINSYDGFLFVREISETKGINDLRDTKIDNGDKAILAHYKDILIGQIWTILVILLVLLLTLIWLIKKWKKKKTKPGARYPGSGRWD